MRKAAFVVLGTICCSAMPSQVLAADKRADVSASVPEVCRFSAPAMTLQEDGSFASAQAFEACNSGRGYNITAITRELSVGEQLVLNYGNDQHDLSENGSTVLVRRRGPIFKIVDLRLQAVALTQPINLTFAMSAV